MQSAPNVEQSSAAQVLTKLFELVNRNDQTWIDLFAEDAVFECPYAPLTTKRFEGKAAIYNFLRTVFVQMSDWRFSNIRIYPTTNPNLAWAEFHGEAVAVATSRPYQQDFVVRLETREGRVIHYREYSNPMASIEAWGGTQNLQQAFNLHNAEDAA
jgi:ketosteroid isomerase-like protein